MLNVISTPASELELEMLVSVFTRLCLVVLHYNYVPRYLSVPVSLMFDLMVVVIFCRYFKQILYGMFTSYGMVAVVGR